MELKPHDKLLEVLQLFVLEDRLLIPHRMKEKVHHDYKIKLAEVKGEEQLDYPLGFLDSDQYLILHNLRIKDDVGYFQIDTLVLCRRYILILEAKNWYGTLFFSSDGNVVRIGDDDKEEGFPNPVVQVKMQRLRLKKWLNKHGFSNTIPILYSVVISNPSTIIKSIHPNESIPEQIIFSNELYLRILKMNQVYTKIHSDMKQLNIIADHLIKRHTAPLKNLLIKYGINHDDIQPGVKCPGCLNGIMVRKRQKWFCNQCNFHSPNAHLKTLFEYKLLFGNTITNKQARYFLGIDSHDMAKRLLQFAGLTRMGQYKGAYYVLEGKTIDAQVRNFTTN